MIVNDGSAQRSIVKSITLVFAEPVTLGSGAVGLTRRVGGGAADVACDVTNPSGDGRTWVVGGFGQTGLIDGRYNVTVRAGGVHAVSSGRAMAADVTLTTHRLFGDADGDGGVSIVDFNGLSAAFATTRGSAAFDAAFDADGDDGISIVDFNEFAARFGKMV